MKNVRELLIYDMNGAFALCKERLRGGEDYQYVGFIQRCRSQLSASITKIAEAYYANVEKNATIHGEEAIISTPDSKVKVVVVPTDEEIVIARDTKALVTQ